MQAPGLLYAKHGNLVADPKNLRNFFIQSSLTFNGNNLGSNTKHDKSAGGSQRANADLKLEVSQSQMAPEESILEEGVSLSDEYRVAKLLDQSS